MRTNYYHCAGGCARYDLCVSCALKSLQFNEALAAVEEPTDEERDGFTVIERDSVPEIVDELDEDDARMIDAWRRIGSRRRRNAIDLTNGPMPPIAEADEAKDGCLPFASC